MGAHGSRAAFWTPRITFMGVRVGVVFHLVVPGLDMEGRRTVSVWNEKKHRQTAGSVTVTFPWQKGNIIGSCRLLWLDLKTTGWASLLLPLPSGLKRRVRHRPGIRSSSLFPSITGEIKSASKKKKNIQRKPKHGSEAEQISPSTYYKHLFLRCWKNAELIKGE